MIRVDPQDQHILDSRPWHVDVHGYVVGKHERLHRLIVGAKKGEHVDHINHDKLDNRRVNLRVCDHRTNQQNRKGAAKQSRSGVLGVQWEPRGKKWVVHCVVNGKNTDCGRFASLDDARTRAIEVRKRHYPGFVESNHA